MVSKRRDRPYQAGRSKHWIKVKNGKHPATESCGRFFPVMPLAEDRKFLARFHKTGSEPCFKCLCASRGNGGG